MANGKPEEWVDIFAANEVIWVSELHGAREKQNAWRTQSIMLGQATRHLDDTIHYAVNTEHLEKLERNRSTEEILNQRVERCLQTLNESRRRSTGKPMEFKMPPPSSFEPLCHGCYESCKYDELTLSDLQKLRIDGGTNENVTRNPIPRNAATGPPVAAANVRVNGRQALPAAVQSDPNWLGFRTAREQQELDDLKKNKPHGVSLQPAAAPADLMNYRKKKLGGRRTVHSNYVPPMEQGQGQGQGQHENHSTGSSGSDIPASLSHLDAQMVEQIMGESLQNAKNVAWEDIAGLESAKTAFMEAIILPLRRPDLFIGVRSPPRGVLLFGPPGTGKTLIAKSIASQAKAKFFGIKPSTLTSKWVGEAEKLVKTLFAVAIAHQPAIIFIDEVDSLLSKRSGNENESTLRLKNEFLIHLDGAATNDEQQILVIGATNRPQELDEAVRRRFVRRLYVPLPTKEARQQIIEKIIAQVTHSLSSAEFSELAELTDGYSGADVDSLCRYALRAPLRSLSLEQMETVQLHELPAVTMEDFKQSLKVISKSVSQEDCQRFDEWNALYGNRH
ncbi:fidgetin-like protein 1 isoform X2 [Drosophila subobscura]|uniref:fidgetin-like protein 1 isoform X2 n=1 Tax=Drosophila subobscura TaxID=7241 RepID=UPI00155AE8C7|nr:fidgetin-like protein 1 isoform X2 [Drosophila subobscura]